MAVINLIHSVRRVVPNRPGSAALSSRRRRISATLWRIAVAALVVGGSSWAISAPTKAASRVVLPRITQLRVSRRTVGTRGGPVAVRVQVKDATTCWLTATTGVSVTSRHFGCRNGRLATVVHVEPADATKSARLTITAWASAGTKHTKKKVSIRESGLKSLIVTSSALTGFVVGSSFSAILSGTGGTAPYQWRITSGSLPDGLSLESDGVVAGTPTATGDVSVVVEVTDSSRPRRLVANKSIAIDVAPTPVSITTTSLAEGVAYESYYETLSAAGGTGPYTWTLSSGALPAGVSLESDGAVTGLPMTPGTYVATVQVTDSSAEPESASEPITIVVAPAPLSVETTSLPTATVGDAYSQSLLLLGGTAPYDWTLLSGSLPSGLGLSTGGVISGTPTGAGTYTFVVEVLDSSSPQKMALATLSISVNLGIGPVTLPDGSLASPSYSVTLTASGGSGTYTWTSVAGSLPGGLALSSGGVLSGTLMTAGTYTFAVKATDTVTGMTGEQTYTITVTGT